MRKEAKIIMGMSMMGGKTVSWTSKGDKIGPNTKVTYRDQNGIQSELDMKKLVEKCKKIKDSEMLSILAKDIETSNLQIGFPIIVAMNEIATKLSIDEALEIVISRRNDDSNKNQKIRKEAKK